MRGTRALGTWLAVVGLALVLGSPSAGGSVATRVHQRTPAAPDATLETLGSHFTDGAATAAGPVAEAPPQRYEPHLLVRVPGPLAARARPNAGARVVGTVVTSSKYYHVPMVAWVERVSRDGRWGLVELPYVWPRREGWVPLRGLRRVTTPIEVRVDLSRRRVTVFRRTERLFGFPAAIGAAVSPTPPGDYAVTDRIPFRGRGYLGSFAFGISGIQPKLPPGWSGGNQLAIHGTNDPSSIGRPASAGCIRVSEAALARLKPLLRLGTPVVITR